MQEFERLPEPQKRVVAILEGPASVTEDVAMTHRAFTSSSYQVFYNTFVMFDSERLAMKITIVAS